MFHLSFSASPLLSIYPSMPFLSSIFLVLALVFAVVIGPQTRPWTWGPAMIALGLATLAALPVFWKRGKAPGDFGMLAIGGLTAAWFAWRAWISPVAEFAEADLLLAAGVVGAFVSVRAIAGNPTAERTLGWGITLLLLANVIVIIQQIVEPGFTPLFKAREGSKIVSGFFGHYIEAANYLVASSMLVGAAALFGRHATWTRVIWFLIAVAGLAGVWFTRGRAGILGAAVALGVFAIFALMIAKQRNSRWFAPALVAVPIVGLIISAFLYFGWSEAQEVRNISEGVGGIMDNHARLYFLGIALSCIGQHPMGGGGSRSFSWECFRFVDGKAQGDIITHKPDLVHNEFMQAATDYGLVGAGLLILIFGSWFLATVFRVLYEERLKEPDERDAWRVGGMATIAGLLTQSCFSFVFHLMPGILLLGISLGCLSRSNIVAAGPRVTGNKLLLSFAAVACACLLLPAGWKGVQVTRILWPSHFSKTAQASVESAVDAYGAAIKIWPQSTFHQERGAIYQKIAAEKEGPQSDEYAQLAIDDYIAAHQLHPYDPANAVNVANVLSLQARDAEAESWYAKSVELQGGMEPGFRGHFSFSNHYLRKGLRLYASAQVDQAHAAMELAVQHMETAVKKMHWLLPGMGEARISIHESLGTARESVGDPEGALESYNFASSLHAGQRAHYRAGVLIGKMAVEDWSKRRPSEAMAKFIEARRRVGLAGKTLPLGVSPSQSIEYIDYLDRTIAFLKGAKIEPKN
jgi:hypothetical protein